MLAAAGLVALLSACGGGGGGSGDAALQSASASSSANASDTSTAAALQADTSASASQADVPSMAAQSASQDAAPAPDAAASSAPAVSAAVAAQAIQANDTSTTPAMDAPNQSALAVAGALPSAVAAASSATQLATLSQTQGLLLPIRTATENWTNAKRLATTDSGWASWLAGRRNLVNRWFAVKRDSASYIAGYPNDFVNPTTGAAASWSIDMAPPAIGTTAAEIKYQQAWVAINRQYNISRTLDAARFYLLTGDKTLAETAATQLDFYAANYASWPLRTAIGNARMLAQSLDEASSALEMLETAKALQGYVTTTRMATWRDKLFKPIAANLQTYAYGDLNNINLWCAAGVAGIGLQFGDAALLTAGTTGSKGLSAVLAQGVTRDGVWAEGSFAYNNYVVLAFARFFDIAALNGRADMVQKYAPDVQRMLLAPVLFRFDDNTLPTPSDTRGAVPPVDTGTHAALYRHVPTSYGVQAAAATRSWATLLDVPAIGVVPGALPASQTIQADDTRMLLMRKGNWQLFVHYGQKTINHAQEEALSYELVHGTTSITRDAGTATSYGAPQHLDYFSKGVGNNVPLIDGLGQEQWAPGTVRAFDPTTGGFDVLQPTYRHDVSASRTFALTSTGMAETTRMTLLTAGAAARRMGVMFNTPCTISVSDPRAGTASTSAAPSGPAGFAYFTKVTKQQAQATWIANLACSGKNYELTVTGPGAHTVYRATVPNTPLPATRNALYVETAGKDVSFTTKIRALP